MLRHKYLKSRELSLDVESDEYIIRYNFGGCVMICFKLQRGASHVSLSQEARKGSMVRLGLNSCLLSMMIRFVVFCRTFAV